MSTTISQMLYGNSTNQTSDVYYVDCPSNDTETNNTFQPPHEVNALTIFLVTSYSIIFLVGIAGNGLVIYIVLRFAKMKTVTNLYLLNLAFSDALFLTSLPFLIVTTLLRKWIFGMAMCKIYFVLFSINLFTSVFQLTALSADRYLAVCHPVRSSRYRNTTIAFFICLCMWSVSFFVMLPIIMYSTTISIPMVPDVESCTIQWPDGQAIPPDKAFTWYTFLLGFAIPVSLISVLYVSVVLRLRHVGPAIKSKEKKRTHRKVTRMVLAVISVYIICWLPYWVYQIDLTFQAPNSMRKEWEVFLLHGFTILTMGNSMLNPLLYAFLSENFRRSFVKAFQCISSRDINKSLSNENSIFPKSSKKRQKSRQEIIPTKSEKYEMTTMITTADNGGHPKNGSVSSVNDGNEMYVDKESQTL